MDSLIGLALLRFAPEQERVEAVHRIDHAQDVHVGVDAFLQICGHISHADLVGKVAVKTDIVEQQRLATVIGVVEVVGEVDRRGDDDRLTCSWERGFVALHEYGLVHDVRFEQQADGIVGRYRLADRVAIQRDRAP